MSDLKTPCWLNRKLVPASTSTIFSLNLHDIQSHNNHVWCVLYWAWCKLRLKLKMKRLAFLHLQRVSLLFKYICRFTYYCSHKIYNFLSQSGFYRLTRKNISGGIYTILYILSFKKNQSDLFFTELTVIIIFEQVRYAININWRALTLIMCNIKTKGCFLKMVSCRGGKYVY